MTRANQLIYTSKATRPLSPSELEALAEQSQRFNHAHGITGLLLHGNGRFMQLLEGEPAAVQSLYFDRIIHDPRHTDCRVLLNQPTANRLLPDWSMGRVYLERTPESADEAWDLICLAIAEQNPAAVFGREPSVAYLHQFIYHDIA